MIRLESKKKTQREWQKKYKSNKLVLRIYTTQIDNKKNSQNCYIQK